MGIGGVILRNYANQQIHPTLAANCTILVIDHENWFAVGSGDHDLHWKGPQVVRFTDPQSQSDRKVDSIAKAAFANDKYQEYETREHIEFSIEELPQARDPNRDSDKLQTRVYDVREETKLEKHKARMYNREINPSRPPEEQGGEENNRTIEGTRVDSVQALYLPPVRQRVQRHFSFSIKPEGQQIAVSTGFEVSQNGMTLLKYTPVRNDDAVDGISLSYFLCVLFGIETVEALETIPKTTGSILIYS